MRSIGGAVTSLLVSTSILLSNGVTAQTGNSITDLIPLIPPCAMGCIVAQFTPEILTNPAASCRNATLQLIISTCVQGRCNYTEQAKLGHVNSGLCEGVPLDMSRANALIIVAATVGPLGIIAILLRTYSRWAITKKMGADDWTMLAAGVFLVGVLACNFENIHTYGFGRHYWNIDPTKVTALLQIFYAAEIFYVMVITLVKVSIIQFYLRVFPTPWFRIANLITMALVVAAGFGVLIPIFFQCNPIRGAWDKSIASKCLNINLLAYATGGIAVGFDIIILILPVPELLRLKMGLRKKLSVLFMFSLGSIACVTSMVRLKYLGDFARSTDATYDNTIPVLWSILEICIAIICACLPALRALFAHFLPKLFPDFSTTASSKRYHQHDASNNSAGIKSGGNNTTLSSTSGVSRKKEIISPTSTVVEKAVRNPISRNGSWLELGGGSTTRRTQEIVQDIEREAIPLPTAFENGLHRNNTVTTKIWVAPTDSAGTFVSPLGPSIERELNNSQAKYHGTYHLKTTPVERDLTSKTQGGKNHQRFDRELPVPKLDPRVSSLFAQNGTLNREISHNGSEDSIFALQGPRDSDLDDDDSMIGRGRSRSERDEEIEMNRLEHSRRRNPAVPQEANGSRNGSLASRGRVPVSVFNRNPPYA